MAVFTEAQLQAVMTEVFDQARHKAQYSRGGNTSRWFTRKSDKFVGREYHFYALTIPSTGSRGMTHTQARDEPYPEASSPTTVELIYKNTDVTYFKSTVEYNEIDESESETPKAALFRVAKHLVQQAMGDTDATHNMAIHLDTNGTLGTIVTRYDDDGTGYSTGNATAFWAMNRADIGRFQPGLVLKSDQATQAALTIVVSDVITGKDGPARGGSYVSDIGPGIVVSFVSGTDTDLDNATNTSTVSRSEAVSGAGVANSNFSGLASWMSRTTNVYFDRDGNALDRDAIGNAWSIPNIVDYTDAGDTVPIDIDVHFRDVAVIAPSRMRAGRLHRQGLGEITAAKEALNLPEVLVAVGPHSLIESAAEQIGDSQRFTSFTANSVDAARRKELFGQTGFDGTVIHSATLPPIALQSDKLARKNKLSILDPQSFQFLKAPGPEMVWVKQNGGIWHVKPDASTGRLTETKQGGYRTSALLFNDQPGVNFELQGLRSDRETA